MSDITSRPQRISLIAAVASNGGIGRNNDLLWNDSRDQKHFRASTMGCPVIMGRRTWDSLPERFRPLPGRRNVVVTRNQQWQAPGAEVAHSLTEALQITADAEHVFVMGGGQLYNESIGVADTLVLTELDAAFEADTFFPAWNREDFQELARESHTTVAGWQFHFVTYSRRKD